MRPPLRLQPSLPRCRPLLAVDPTDTSWDNTANRFKFFDAESTIEVTAPPGGGGVVSVKNPSCIFCDFEELTGV